MGLDTYRAYKIDQSKTFGEIWSKALNRYIKSGMTATDYKTIEEWEAFGDPTLAIGEQSQPPAKPQRPSGPSTGKFGTEYTFTSSTTDPEGDKISYIFDWGDGTYTWVGPLNSGSTASAKKTWIDPSPTNNDPINYTVKVAAKDSHGITSVWSDPLGVTMPLSYEPPLMHFLERLFELFPHAFRCYA